MTRTRGNLTVEEIKRNKTYIEVGSTGSWSILTAKTTPRQNSKGIWEWDAITESGNVKHCKINPRSKLSNRPKLYKDGG